MIVDVIVHDASGYGVDRVISASARRDLASRRSRRAPLGAMAWYSCLFPIQHHRPMLQTVDLDP